MDDIYKGFVSKGAKVHNLNSDDILVKDEWIWFLGFLWADGCLGKKAFSLELKEADFLEIWPILQEIGFKTYTSRTRQAKYKQCCITTSQCVQTLRYFDFDQKSYQPPNKLWNMLSNKRRWLFLRGYFEGDGSYSPHGKKAKDLKNQRYRITLNGSINYCYKFIFEFFKSHDIPLPCIERKSRVQRGKLRSYSILTWSKAEVVKQIFKLMYGERLDICLRRKKDIAVRYMNEHVLLKRGFPSKKISCQIS
jgi:hypothetical protein